MTNDNEFLDYVYCDLVEAAAEPFRNQFEPMLQATAHLPEVQVLAALTLRIRRLSKITRWMCEEGYAEESQILFRSATEAMINLLYIMDVGPRLGHKARPDLTEQFLAYGDVAYLKLLTGRGSRARDTFKKRKGFTDQDYDQFFAAKEQKEETARRVHGCQSIKWSKYSFAKLSEFVRENLPDYVDPKLSYMLFECFAGANSAVHGDALSLRSQYEALGNKPLEFVLAPENNYADSVAMQVTWAWKANGRYFNRDDWVEDLLAKEMRRLVSARVKTLEEEALRPRILTLADV
jgi:hypothetical protein